MKGITLKKLQENHEFLVTTVDNKGTTAVDLVSVYLSSYDHALICQGGSQNKFNTSGECDSESEVVWACVYPSKGYFTHIIRMEKKGNRIEGIYDLDLQIGGNSFDNECNPIVDELAESLMTLQYEPIIGIKAAMLMKCIARNMGFRVDVWSDVVSRFEEKSSAGMGK